jgi:TRAP transporter TAXI family solute receptor
MFGLRHVATVLLLVAGFALTGCDAAPDEAATREVLQERLGAALKPPVTEVTSFRRLGSGPLPAGADGAARRIVYYNAVLKLTQDVDFSSWNGLNAAAFATLLGASEKGLMGIKPEGNKTGDELRVHGSATFVQRDGAWEAVPWVAPELGVASPENNTGPPSEAKRLLDSIQALLGGNERALRATIVSEELARSYAQMQLRIDRLDRDLVVAGGPEGGEYAGVAALLASRLERQGVRVRAATTSGSFENLKMVADGQAGIGFVQSDVAAAAANGTGTFASAGPNAELRALASLFPEPVQIVVAAGSPIAAIVDLKGKRVDLGLPGSGTRANAEAVLAASGVALGDLGEVKEEGLVAGLSRLAAGEVDAVITTLAAPAQTLQRAAAGPGIKLLSIGPQERTILAGAHPEMVAVTLPPNTYPGQTETVETVAVTALLLGTAGMPDSTVETVMGDLFGGIDFIAAGSVAGSLITKETARTGLTLPLHPAAERFLLRDASTQ